ncbi:MAG: hypothetical protein IT373_28505 [Polyangiaceae bacterium]|nr:hypothetical protein [Polyangiaceae bacterium]
MYASSSAILDESSGWSFRTEDVLPSPLGDHVTLELVIRRVRVIGILDDGCAPQMPDFFDATATLALSTSPPQELQVTGMIAPHTPSFGKGAPPLFGPHEAAGTWVFFYSTGGMHSSTHLAGQRISPEVVAVVLFRLDAVYHDVPQVPTRRVVGYLRWPERNPFRMVARWAPDAGESEAELARRYPRCRFNR